MSTFPSNQENNHQDHTPDLQLSIGSSHFENFEKTNNELNNHENFLSRNVSKCCIIVSSPNENASNFVLLASRVKEEVEEQLKLAMEEKAYAEQARRRAKRQIELAEDEFLNAKRIRQQAQEELERAHQALREHAIKKVSSTFLEITCFSCKKKFRTVVANNNNNNNNTSSSSIQEIED